MKLSNILETFPSDPVTPESAGVQLFRYLRARLKGPVTIVQSPTKETIAIGGNDYHNTLPLLAQALGVLPEFSEFSSKPLDGNRYDSYYLDSFREKAFDEYYEKALGDNDPDVPTRCDPRTTKWYDNWEEDFNHDAKCNYWRDGDDYRRASDHPFIIFNNQVITGIERSIQHLADSIKPENTVTVDVLLGPVIVPGIQVTVTFT